MTVEELVKRFRITKADGGRIRIPSSIGALNALDEIKSKKAEIIAFLDAKEAAERKAREEREAKINAIEGLKEIRAARYDFEAWQREWEKSFEHCGGLGVRKRPEYDFKALYAKYPVAYAYLQAECEANSENYEIAAIGRKALEAIINDQQNYENAIAEMRQELSEFADRHAFD